MLRVIVFFGLPGAGKSYLSQKLCARKNYVNFDSDLFASRFFVSNKNISQCFEAATELFCNIAISNKTFSGTFVFTDSVTSQPNLDKLQELANCETITLEYIKIGCSLNTALTRLDGRQDYHIDENLESDLKTKQLFHDGMAIECRVLDNDADDLIDEKLYAI